MRDAFCDMDAVVTVDGSGKKHLRVRLSLRETARQKLSMYVVTDRR